MTEVISSPWFVAGIFFIIAAGYSSVGLGGGSSYTALMAILGFGVLAIPMISLTLNLFVTTLGSYNFIRNRHARLELILPFLVSSVPMAYLGGTLNLEKEIFQQVLLVSLLFVAARIYIWDDIAIKLETGRTGKRVVALLSGSVLGLVAGIVGIGGGIYLVPLIIILGLGSEKEAAACGAIFVWLNSLSGLIARLQYNAIDLSDYLPLMIAVVAGGALGSFMGATRLRPNTLQKILGVIIIVAIVALCKRLLSS
jgi:uncharacterized membrane protein YfcA